MPRLLGAAGGVRLGQSALGLPVQQIEAPRAGGLGRGGTTGNGDGNTNGGDGNVNGGKSTSEFGGRGKHYASDTMAKLVRQQWADWLKRFSPYEEKLREQTSYENPSILTNALSDAQKSTEHYYNTALEAGRMGINDYGIVRSRDTEDANTRLNRLSRTASLVDAANRIRQKVIDRDRAIAFGGELGGDRQLLAQTLSGGQS